MKLLKDKYKRRGAIAALLFHLLLLILFMLFGLTQPVPLPTDAMEIAMDFGFSETGMGDIESPVVSDNPTEVVEQATTQEISQQTESSAEEVAVQEESIVKVTNTSKSNSQSDVKEQKVEEEKKVSSQLASALQNPFANSGGGQGDGSTPGNVGDPDGKTGKGVLGGGMGWELAGRKIVKEPIKPKGFQEEGTVVVNIKVGKDGHVVDVKIDYDHTGTSSPVLHELALKSARTAVFDAVSTARIHEWGSITYKFRLSGG